MATESKVYKSLTDIINADDRYDVNKVLFYTTTDDGELIIPDMTLFDIYYKFMTPYIQTLNVTPEQARFYRFRPHLLSLDIYGTPYLAWLILKLNDKECPSKFWLKKTVRIVSPDSIAELYDIIANKSSTRLVANHNKYLSMVGGNTGGS